jgi:hypothetical protein
MKTFDNIRHKEEKEDKRFDRRTLDLPEAQQVLQSKAHERGPVTQPTVRHTSSGDCGPILARPNRTSMCSDRVNVSSSFKRARK